MASPEKKGTLAKTNSWILKWPGLFGTPFYIFLFGGVAKANALNPEAGLIDGAGVLYNEIFNTAVGPTLDGMAIVAVDALNFTADTLMPGLGLILSAVFRAASAGTQMASAGHDMVAGFSAAPALEFAV